MRIFNIIKGTKNEIQLRHRLQYFFLISAKANVDPPPKQSLQELINANIFVETDGFAG